MVGEFFYMIWFEGFTVWGVERVMGCRMEVWRREGVYRYGFRSSCSRGIGEMSLGLLVFINSVDRILVNGRWKDKWEKN